MHREVQTCWGIGTEVCPLSHFLYWLGAYVQFSRSIYLVDLDNNKLYMEQIIGKTLKDILWTHAKGNPHLCFRPSFVTYTCICIPERSEGNEEGREALIAIAKGVGAAIGKMHDAEIVHGDLTTSNLMVKSNGGDVVVIDFGLGMMKPTQEDKAVDLYVLERAFISTHPGSEYLVSPRCHLAIPCIA